MTEREAKEEATRLWPAHGAWAKEETVTSYDRHGNPKHKLECVLGIHEDSPEGVKGVVIARAGDWNAAFAKAGKWWDRQKAHRVGHKRAGDIVVERGGLPMAGELL